MKFYAVPSENIKMVLYKYKGQTFYVCDTDTEHANKLCDIMNALIKANLDMGHQPCVINKMIMEYIVEEVNVREKK